MKQIYLLLVVLLFSCTGENKYEEFNFGEFTIVGPKSWKVVNVNGIDSYVKEIITENQDTLYFDYGYYSNPLEDKILPYHREDIIQILVQNGYDEKKLRAENDSVHEQALRERKEIYEYETISGFRAKIVKPKVIGQGITGVYFDSLGTESGMNISLNFLGVDLSEEDHEELLKALKTIKIKE
jgi:hypothetical protein